MAAATVIKWIEPGIAKLSDGGYRVDVRPEGKHGPRHRKRCDTAGEAKRHKAKMLSRASDGLRWKAPPKDLRRMEDLASEWHRVHGHTLSDGKLRLGKIHHIIRLLGNPLARDFSEDDYLSFREKRLADGLSPNTCNHDLAYLKSMFNRLRKSGVVENNPLSNISKLAHPEAEIRFLELSEMSRLLDELKQSKSPDGLIITKICLATGARWSEAERLRGEQVSTGRIEYSDTKNGKARAIPISEKLEKEIIEGRPKYGRLFAGAYEAFGLAVRRAEIVLPKGQRSHVLRHSFAVHFMRQSGNILDLQKILGHKTLQMTLRYAQFHPDYLADAVNKNPLAALELT